MIGSAWSVALLGTDGTPVEVEAAIGGGLPRTVLVGLPDTALYEARDRCRAAFSGAGLAWPNQLLTINLTPASLPKSGSHYDLAIVTAVLVATQACPRELALGTVFMGELGLDGRVRPVRGVLPALLAARTFGLDKAVVPRSQVREANLVDGITVWGVSSLDDLVEVMHGRPVLGEDVEPAEPAPQSTWQPDLADVVGQPQACLALEVAAAGGHHLFLSGPPGVGKTMLAERLPGLLPDLGEDESLEVSAIHSLAGHDLNGGLIRRPPFANPHHNASVSALVGGGARVARPGAISMAHRGVLFLDEAPEFSPKALEALRTPMESGWITIARSQVTMKYPARFQLILAANPCPCGLAATARTRCRCSPLAITRYRERLSGPILDRIDITQHLPPVKQALLRATGARGESTAVVAARIREARQRQRFRLAGTTWLVNAEVPGQYLRQRLPLPQGYQTAERALASGILSARGIDKVLRVGWSIADLAGHARVTREDLMVALELNRGEQASVAA